MFKRSRARREFMYMYAQRCIHDYDTHFDVIFLLSFSFLFILLILYMRTDYN